MPHGAQAMATADPQAKWLMQAWLFYDNQEFWKPPQIKVCTWHSSDHRHIDILQQATRSSAS